MTVISDEEFKRNGRDSEDPFLAAVQYAMGTASVCWSEEALSVAGEFDAGRAAAVADDLVCYLRKNWCLVARSDLVWLGVLIENAKPRYPGSPQRDWEGQGRANAVRIVNEAANPDTRRKRGAPTSAGVQRGQDRIARK